MGVLRVGFDELADLKLEPLRLDPADSEFVVEDRVLHPPPPQQLTVSCVWSDGVRVSDRMTPIEELITVTPHDSIEEAERRAHAAHVHHLPVLRGGILVGEICGCDLRSARSSDTVAQHMRRDVYVIPSQATLGEAAGAMSRLGCGSLPVIEGERLAGIITRSDLRRVGAPDDAIDGGRCVACGSGHGVRPDPTHDGLAYCPDCTDAGSSMLDARNFGEGD
jgi:CBS domain-containing protein